jgi:hypothetical protein
MAEPDEDYKKFIDLLEQLLALLKKPPACFNSITLPVTGTTTGQPDAATALAAATLDANDKLTKFGDQWCSKGNKKCPGSTCVPTLSNLEVTAEKTTDGLDTKTNKTVYACEVTLKGTVSCYCG